MSESDSSDCARRSVCSDESAVGGGRGEALCSFLTQLLILDLLGLPARSAFTFSLVRCGGSKMSAPPPLGGPVELPQHRQLGELTRRLATLLARNRWGL